MAGSPARSGGGGTRRETGPRRCARDGGGRKGREGRGSTSELRPPPPTHTASKTTTRKNAAAAAGPGRPPNRISSRPPGGFSPPYLGPGDRPRPYVPGRPPFGGSDSTAAGRPDEERKERKPATGGEGERHQTNEGRRRRRERPRPGLPRKAPHRGPGETANPGGDGARGVEPAGITLHTPRAVPPPRPRHRADPRPTAPREPRETPTRERPRRAHRRRPPDTLERQRIPTSDDAPDAAKPPFPQKRPPPRARSVPQDTDPPGHRGGEENPAISPVVGTLPRKGERGDQPHGPRAHTTRTPRGVRPVAGGAQDENARGPGDARGGRHGRKGRRVGPGAHRRHPTLRPATTLGVRGVPRTRASARPFPRHHHHLHNRKNPDTRLSATAGRRALPRVIPPRARSGEARAAVDERTDAARTRWSRAAGTRGARSGGAPSKMTAHPFSEG